MSASIQYRETTDLSSSAFEVSNGLAFRLDLTCRITLRFRLQYDSEEDLDALRYARRLMIREEHLRGLEWEEPSIEDAEFTALDVSWPALASQAAWCREKMGELVGRANRVRRELCPNGVEEG
jgi:hypothetical protein